MSRPREFDIDLALHQAMEVFWNKGFKSTSFEDLTRTTNVKKQSLYCAFKDKRAFFLKTLALYRELSITSLQECISQELSPLKQLESISDALLRPGNNDVQCGCLMVNSMLEFGNEDEEVSNEIQLLLSHIEQFLERIIRSGQEQKLITTRFSSHDLAASLHNALLGARVLEKSGASKEQIQSILRTSFAMMKP